MLQKLTVSNLKKLTSLKYLSQKFHELWLGLTCEAPRCSDITGYLHPLEEKRLYQAASIVHKGVIVEVGSYYGRSTVCMAQGIREKANQSHIWAVDTWRNENIPVNTKQDIYGAFLKNINEYQDIVTPLRGFSKDVAGSWNKPIDLLFIDGDHSFDGCFTDINAWVPFVRRGGVVMFHDSGLDGVKEAIVKSKSLLKPLRQYRIWSMHIFHKG